MKRLSKVVNIVPVIAKADTLTLEERDYFKQRVRGCCLFPGLPSLVPHPLVPLSPSWLPRRGCAGRAWPGAQRIPPAAARSDPAWPQGRPALQALPGVSLGSLSAQDKFGALRLRACFSCLLCYCCCYFQAGFCYFGNDGAARRGWKTLPLQQSCTDTGTRQKCVGLLSPAGQAVRGKQGMKFPWLGAEEGLSGSTARHGLCSERGRWPFWGSAKGL